jgi:hypothetical protein
MPLHWWIFGWPTVEVSLQLTATLVATPAELERFLADIRRQIAHQLDANHRVRFR